MLGVISLVIRLPIIDIERVRPMHRAPLRNIAENTRLMKPIHPLFIATISLLMFIVILGSDQAGGLLAQSESSTLTFQISASADDVNEHDDVLETNRTSLWLGDGSSTQSSFTGLRFTDVSLPPRAVILSATVEVYPTNEQWIAMSYLIGAEDVGNSAVFSTTNRPSQRILTTQQVTHRSDDTWAANTWHSLEDIAPTVQAVVNRPDWRTGNSLSIILKGTGTLWGRKYVQSFDGDSGYAPRLVITFAPEGTSLPDATPTPEATSTPGSTAMPPATPTDAPSPTSTPTSAPTFEGTPMPVATAKPEATSSPEVTTTPEATPTDDGKNQHNNGINIPGDLSPRLYLPLLGNT
jgi:hypothetical protein